jgi:cytoskeletal protein CcmA (bactofilin family)
MDNSSKIGDLYIGSGVVAHCVAIVPGRAVVNGRLDGAIDAQAIDVQEKGIVSGTTQAATIAVAGTINDTIHAADTLAVGSTGMVSGTISYGKLEVAKGGELLGTMKQL